MTRTEIEQAVAACTDSRWPNVTVPTADLGAVLSRLAEVEKLAMEANKYKSGTAAHSLAVEQLVSLLTEGLK